jgi:ABC-type dipeptide/oligopeptide/nickel transport system permease component
MASYIVRRLASLIFVILAVSMIVFALMHSVPGGPFDEDKQPLPPAAKANILRKYGLDRPVWEQYLRYMWHAVQLDFGIPYQSPTETIPELISRVWIPTIQIGLLTILLAFTLGPLLGIVAALHHNSAIDYSSSFLSALGLAVPNFIFALWLILLFAVRLKLLPTGGWGEPKHFVLPVIAYTLAPMAIIARYTRSSMLDAMRGDYVRTARAKGLRERTVTYRHILRNALIPVITVFAPMIPNILTGSIFIEATFRIPGLGKFFITSTFERDYPMIMALVLLVAVLWGFTFLLSDLLYTVADPRINFEGKS